MATSPFFLDHTFGYVYQLRDGAGFSQGAVNFWAGLGDGASFGATNWIRDKMGTNDVVDKCSGIYRGANLAGGVVGGVATGGVLAAGRNVRLAYNTGLSDALASGRINTRYDAWAFRRNFGLVNKKLTPFPVQWGTYGQNLWEYGDKLGPPFSSINPAKSIEDILKKTNQKLNLFQHLPPGLDKLGGGLGLGERALSGANDCGC